MKIIRFIMAALFLLSLVFFAATPQSAEAASVYSVNIIDIQVHSSHASQCLDDTCDDYQNLYAIDVDVTERLDPISVDICFFVDTDQTVATATVTATGSFYTGSYVADNTWNCGASNGTLSTSTSGTGWKCGPTGTDQMFCKMRIDQDTNARITVTGRNDAPYECASDSQNVGSPPNHDRFTQADIYKHNDASKSGGDSFTDSLSCYNGNDTDTDSSGVYDQYAIFYNGGGGTYFKPAGTSFKMVEFQMWQLYDVMPGPITFKGHFTTPTYVVITSCPVSVVAGSLSSPGNPSACTISGSGHTADITLTFNSTIDVRLAFWGTIGTPTGCPFMGSQSKSFFDQQWFYRDHDGAWQNWGGTNLSFGCS